MQSIIRWWIIKLIIKHTMNLKKSVNGEILIFENDGNLTKNLLELREELATIQPTSKESERVFQQLSLFVGREGLG